MEHRPTGNPRRAHQPAAQRPLRLPEREAGRLWAHTGALPLFAGRWGAAGRHPVGDRCRHPGGQRPHRPQPAKVRGEGAACPEPESGGPAEHLPAVDPRRGGGSGRMPGTLCRVGPADALRPHRGGAADPVPTAGPSWYTRCAMPPSLRPGRRAPETCPAAPDADCLARPFTHILAILMKRRFCPMLTRFCQDLARLCHPALLRHHRPQPDGRAHSVGGACRRRDRRAGGTAGTPAEDRLPDPLRAAMPCPSSPASTAASPAAPAWLWPSALRPSGRCWCPA